MVQKQFDSFQTLTCIFVSACGVQVYWNSLSRTYWVHWHMVEILGSGSSSQAEKETQEKASSLTQTLRLTAGKT